MAFAANVFQFEKPVGIGNDVLKESITKPRADLQGIIATFDKPNQIACGEIEVSGIRTGYTDKAAVGIVFVIFIIEED